MWRLEVSAAVRHIYIYIYVVMLLKVKQLVTKIVLHLPLI